MDLSVDIKTLIVQRVSWCLGVLPAKRLVLELNVVLHEAVQARRRAVQCIANDKKSTNLVSCRFAQSYS